MAYRLNINKEKLGDFIIMILFDKFFDKEFLSKNEKFNEVFHKMESLGLKSYMFTKYFDVDPSLRSKYKLFRSQFDKEDSIVSLMMFDEEMNESYSEYENIILECVTRITGNSNPNPEKLKDFTNEVINDIIKSNEGDE